MASGTLKLKTMTHQGLALIASFLSAAKLTEVDSNGLPSGQATFKHTGTSGYWYVTLKRSSGPTASDFSFKIGPGEAPTEMGPPIGEIWALADSDVDGDLSWYVGWAV